MRQDFSEYCTQCPITYEFFQSGQEKLALILALCACWILFPLTFWMVLFPTSCNLFIHMFSVQYLSGTLCVSLCECPFREELSFLVFCSVKFSCFGLTRSPKLWECPGVGLSFSLCVLAWKNSQDIKLGKPRAHLFVSCLSEIAVLPDLISIVLKTIVSVILSIFVEWGYALFQAGGYI